MTDSGSPRPFTVVRDGDLGLERLPRPFVAIGNFDGVHRGHRAVIGQAMDRARGGAPAGGRAHLRAASAQLLPARRAVVPPDRPRRRSSGCLPRPASTARSCSPSTRRSRSSAPRISSQNILVDRLGVSGAVIGFNFHFGKDRRGSPDFLKAQGAHHGFSVRCRAAVHARWPAGVVGRGARCAGRGPHFGSRRAAWLSLVRHRAGGARRQARPRRSAIRPPISGSAPTAASSTASMRFG